MKTHLKTAFFHLLIITGCLSIYTLSFSQDCSGKRYRKYITSSTNSVLDVKYGSNLAQDGVTNVDLHVDIYTPQGDTATNRPLFILAHGGFFSMGDKSQLAGLAKELAKMGYVSASMQYRLLDMTDPEVYMNPPLAFFIKRQFVQSMTCEHLCVFSENQ